MTTIMPEGEALRKAVKWISAEISEHPDKSVQKLVNEAVTRFDLSPKDTEFLMSFYRKSGELHGGQLICCAKRAPAFAAASVRVLIPVTGPPARGRAAV